MLFAITFPIIDLRPFADPSAPRLLRPTWPDPDPRADYVRGFGPVRPRPRGGVPGWGGEDLVCEAYQPLTFDGLRQKATASPRPLACAFKRLYCDGKLLAKYDVGVAVADDEFVASRTGTIAGLGVLLNLQTSIRLSKETYVQSLQDAGDPLALAYARATTPAKVAQTTPYVVHGNPCGILEYQVPKGHPRRGTAQNGLYLEHVWAGKAGSQFGVWTLGYEKGVAARGIARDIRVCLARLHAEIESLRRLFRALALKQVTPKPWSDAARQLQDYLRHRVRLLKKLTRLAEERTGTDAVAVAAHLQLRHTVGGTTSLLAQLQAAMLTIDVRPDLRRDVASLAGKGIHVTNIINNSTLTNVNIGSILEQVTQTVNGSAGLDTKEKDELAKQVAELRTSLDELAKSHAAEAEFVAEQLAALMKQAAPPKPQRSASRLQITSKGLIDAAGAVAKIAPKVLSVAKLIAGLVTGTPIP